ncbi:hypothetical protein E2562_011894 [Oryza meyeriana var. granulata]|uniref:Uncharacterized protein n=1 Tax=Oryza meyeriana var. granulata TaxID=110450 RepID=A0A6G1CF89_9ORYZ|nr:hypothetical protein E2562_011894 [Oryza meyeriana var. granulata]
MGTLIFWNEYTGKDGVRPLLVCHARASGTVTDSTALARFSNGGGAAVDFSAGQKPHSPREIITEEEPGG